MIPTEVLAAMLMLPSALLVWRSVYGWFSALQRPAQDMNRLLVMVQAFRTGVIGLVIFGVGIWLFTGQLWILVVSLAVGGEELLESSFIIWALKSDPRSKNQSTVKQPVPVQSSV